jgi:hypothetical protein
MRRQVRLQLVRFLALGLKATNEDTYKEISGAQGEEVFDANFRITQICCPCTATHVPNDGSPTHTQYFLDLLPFDVPGFAFDAINNPVTTATLIVTWDHIMFPCTTRIRATAKWRLHEVNKTETSNCLPRYHRLIVEDKILTFERTLSSYMASYLSCNMPAT